MQQRDETMLSLPLRTFFMLPGGGESKHFLIFSPFLHFTGYFILCVISLSWSKTQKWIWTFQCEHEERSAMVERSFERGGRSGFLSVKAYVSFTNLHNCSVKSSARRLLWLEPLNILNSTKKISHKWLCVVVCINWESFSRNKELIHIKYIS